MDHVIIFKNTLNGKVGFVSEDDNGNNVAVFSSYEKAFDAVDNVPICRAYPYQIVELEI